MDDNTALPASTSNEQGADETIVMDAGAAQQAHEMAGGPDGPQVSPAVIFGGFGAPQTDADRVGEQMEGEGPR